MPTGSLEDRVREDLLKNDPHVKEIIQEAPRISAAVNPDFFLPERIGDARQVYGTLQKLLMDPYIIDDFGNNNDRWEWRKSLTKIQYKAIECNSLKIGHSTAIANFCTLLGRYFSEHVAKTQRDNLQRVESYRKKLRAYEKLNETEKYCLIINYKRDVYGLLVSLSTAKKTSKKATVVA